MKRSERHPADQCRQEVAEPGHNAAGSAPQQGSGS
ncbi:Uncharacterised protein [Mycobacteroides abscessus subsp. abscessus]|nr:Uncharacterised protein [Mycobacteroides abscessus subsp. abscessus]